MEVKSARFSSTTVVFTGEYNGASVGALDGASSRLGTMTSEEPDGCSSVVSSSDISILGYAIAVSNVSILW